jgi:aminoglycoside phosphotransferase family enzyme
MLVVDANKMIVTTVAEVTDETGITTTYVYETHGEDKFNEIAEFYANTRAGVRSVVRGFAYRDQDGNDVLVAEKVFETKL